jgi:cbb3-type cytochrome oxidase subunit 3
MPALLVIAVLVMFLAVVGWLLWTGAKKSGKAAEDAVETDAPERRKPGFFGG